MVGETLAVAVSASKMFTTQSGNSEVGGSPSVIVLALPVSVSTLSTSEA